jgi:hypothetical protein
MVAFKTLPSWSFGKAVTQRYCFGRLKRAMCRSQVALSAVAWQILPDRMTGIGRGLPAK